MFINFCKTKIKKLLFFNNRLIFTTNITIKSCSECCFFIKPISKYPYENDDESDGLCSMFIEKHIISGNVKPIPALHCRTDNKLCGLNGKKFKQIQKEFF